MLTMLMWAQIGLIEHASTRIQRLSGQRVRRGVELVTAPGTLLRDCPSSDESCSDSPVPCWQVDVANHEITKALKQCRNLKNVNCSIKAEFFGVAWAAGQDKPRYTGQFTQHWKNKDTLEVVIKWEGWGRGKSCDLKTLLGNDSPD